jgi:hypothetical protein
MCIPACIRIFNFLGVHTGWHVDNSIHSIYTVSVDAIRYNLEYIFNCYWFRCIQGNKKANCRNDAKVIVNIVTSHFIGV